MTQDQHPFERGGLGKAPYRCVGLVVRTYKAASDAPEQVGGACDYCGQGIKYQFIIRGADGSEFKVGSSCVGKVDRALAREVGARKRAYHREEKARARLASARERARKRLLANVAEAREVLRNDPALADTFRVKHPIIRDIAGRFIRFGSLSSRAREYAEHLAAQVRAEAGMRWVEPSEGRYRVEGEVLATQVQDDPYRPSPYASIVKMLVRVESEAGIFKAWGTAPSALLDRGPLKGRRVAFTARFHPKPGECFGFFSRPSKAEYLDG